MKYLLTLFAALSLSACAATSENNTLDCSLDIPVLMYHDINSDPDDNYSVTPEQFKQHIEYIHSQGYNTVTFDTLDQANENSVIITFDDGYESYVTFAEPVLDRYNYSAVINVVGIWIDQVVPDIKPRLAITWKDINRLIDKGTVQFGSHTYAQHTWSQGVTQYTEKQNAYDMDTMNRVFYQETGHQLNTIAWPYGKYNQAAMQQAKQRYSHIQTSNTGLFNVCSTTVPRYAVEKTSNIESILD